MKKNDLILIGAILVVAVVGLLGMEIYKKLATEDEPYVSVTIDGIEKDTYSLLEDREETYEFENGSYNVLQIKDGYAAIIEADCPDQICVNHKHIKYSGETIVCLPNKLVVEVKNAKESEVDGATH